MLTDKERKRLLRKRYKDKGLKRIEVQVPLAGENKVRDFASRLRKQADLLIQSDR